MSEPWITDSPISERFPFYTRANSGEIAPYPMSPLCWTIVWEHGTNPGYVDGYVRWGSNTRDEFDEVITPFASFGGYVYHNWSLVRLMGERSPGMSAQLMDDAFFGGHSDIPPYEAHPDDERPDLAEKVQATIDALFGAERLPDELAEDRARALANRAARPDLATASDAELVQRALAMSPLIAEFFEPYVIFGTASSFALGTIAPLCEGLDPSLPGRLLSGIGDVDSVPPSIALWDLGRTVAGSAPLTKAFDGGIAGLRDRLVDSEAGRQFLSALDRVCSEHGARGPVEWDVMSPSWETDPDLVLALVDRLRFATDDQSPTARRERIAADRAVAEAELRAHLQGDNEALGALDLGLHLAGIYVPGRERTKLTEMLTVHEVRVAMYELGARMTERGVVDAPNRVFMLLDHELEAFVADPSSFADTIRDRFTRFEELRSKQEPLNIYGDAPDIDSWPLRAAGADPVAVGDVLTGTAGGPGRVVGRARVIHDPGDPRGLEPGDVLVARVTDPAWTPLFMTAGGVVVELGAPMSHAMIVSRELGVPCVTSVLHAAKRITDGMLLEVDGGTGTVTILEAAP
jgi:phosphohistidine swiveling domain-containing protein